MKPTEYTGLLRNSYGFQFNEANIKVTPALKQTSPMHPEQISSSIKQLQNKIEGVETLMRKKTSAFQLLGKGNSSYRFEPPYQKSKQLNVSNGDGRLDVPLRETQLRGSCDAVILKFDYNNLKSQSIQNSNLNTADSVKKVNNQESFERFKQFSPFDPLQKQSSLNTNHQSKVKQMKGSLIQVQSGKQQINFQKKIEFISKPKPIESNLNYNNSNLKFKGIFDGSPKNGSQSKKVQVQKKVETSTPICKKSKSIFGFEFGPSLGQGKFGQVYLSRHSQTGFALAIKKINKSKVLQFKMLDQFCKQIKLHSCLDHPNIVKFYGFFQTKEDIYLTIEYMNGGTLFDYINDKGCVSVRQSVDFLRDIIEALTHLHQKSIAHRDIKPENIVISSEGVAKLCDFGWSALVQTSRKTYCGTFDYAPPQVLQHKNYDASVDIWCIGVLTYELLTGKIPFQGSERTIVRDRIVNVDKFKIDYPATVPQQAREFIQALVQKDPNMRPKCQDLLKFKLFSLYPVKSKKKIQ